MRTTIVLVLAASVAVAAGSGPTAAGAAATPASSPPTAKRVRLFGDEHVRQYEETGGKVGHDWNGASCLILRSVGRKSGATRKVPLIYGRDGSDYLIIASNGGAPNHPGWYENLLAHSDVEIQVRDQIIPVRARTATGEEKKRLWSIMTVQWRAYDEYQKQTQRDIPLVILTPRAKS